MRLLQRASNLLSHLAAYPGSSLDELSEVTDIPRATCARLLKELTKIAWVEYRDRSWHLGPRAQALAEGAPYRGGLLEIARPHMASASLKVGQPVALSVLHGAKRMVLERVWPNGRRDRRIEVGETDPVLSAAGRLLIALQPNARRKRLCTLLKLPDLARWPGCIDLSELNANLIDLAKTRHIAISVRGLATTAVAFSDGVGGWAAFGSFAKLPGHREALQRLRRIAGKIEQELADYHTAHATSKRAVQSKNINACRQVIHPSKSAISPTE